MGRQRPEYMPSRDGMGWSFGSCEDEMREMWEKLVSEAGRTRRAGC